MKNKLRELICKADSAMQNEEYEVAHYVLDEIPQHTGNTPIKDMEQYAIDIHYLSIKAFKAIKNKEYKKTHKLIFKMYDLTQPEEDKIRPTKK